MSEHEDNQPEAEGSAPVVVTEDAAVSGKDAAPAVETDDGTLDAQIGNAFANPDSDDAADDAIEAVQDFLEHAREEAAGRTPEEMQESLECIKREMDDQGVSAMAVPSLSDELKAVVEKLAGFYGVVHSGDHEATANALAGMLGHAAEDLETLIGKLRQQAGV